MSRIQLQDRRIWITGASSGIGRAVAVEMAKLGARVFASARRADRLEQLAADCEPGRVHPLPLDVSERAANLTAVKTIRELAGGLDAAFFNAGQVERVNALEFDSAVYERQIRVNYLGVIYGVEAALPLLRESPRPQIVGVSSIGAFAPLPQSEAYGASKAAVRFFLDSLRIDLEPEGFTISNVAPGFVLTEATKDNEFPMPFLLSPEQAARSIVAGIVRGRANIQPPRRFTIPLRLLSKLPRRLYARIMRRAEKRQSRRS